MSAAHISIAAGLFITNHRQPQQACCDLWLLRRTRIDPRTATIRLTLSLRAHRLVNTLALLIVNDWEAAQHAASNHASPQ